MKFKIRISAVDMCVCVFQIMSVIFFHEVTCTCVVYDSLGLP